ITPSRCIRNSTRRNERRQENIEYARLTWLYFYMSRRSGPSSCAFTKTRICCVRAQSVHEQRYDYSRPGVVSPLQVLSAYEQRAFIDVTRRDDDGAPRDTSEKLSGARENTVLR
ncbi:hypothetical protein LSAT2_026364, partial [Lamellibrachia satsuma]